MPFCHIGGQQYLHSYILFGISISVVLTPFDHTNSCIVVKTILPQLSVSEIRSSISCLCHITEVDCTISCDWWYCVYMCHVTGDIVYTCVMWLVILCMQISCDWWYCVYMCHVTGDIVYACVMWLVILCMHVSCDWWYCVYMCIYL